ncbi:MULTISPECIES: SagB/ThcOx family dehydrogenase [Thiorhodovibrio]|uniref:SagB/ThcOx family dehydrogenase n=1 Tax=Thiorhodovibrio TaxID=61593 RepID=UPI0019119EA1|nr:MULTISPECIES: SagB/ThcOx family dehydrogenase [Thiorhodovibrio]MBK5971178.1 hypothetical protein [Thiorhodovibrio winogradskyi]
MAADTMHAAEYHERTKHHLHGFAAGPGGLDWATQPEAFRDYGDCPQIALPLADQAPAIPFAALAGGVNPAAMPLSIDALGIFLSCSLAISAWKRYGPSRWALRCNPSSGNLHPSEAYLVMPDIPGIPAGLYHYRPQDHRLEQRRSDSTEVSHTLFNETPAGSFLLGLSSIPWREAWKYGERAWRYCLLDLGHALAALRYAARLCGWQVRVLDQWADQDVACLLGLDRADEFIPEEPEYPELLCLVIPTERSASIPLGCLAGCPSGLSAALAERPWLGKANQLSAHHSHHWPLIDEAIRATEQASTRPEDGVANAQPAPLPFRCADSGVTIIQRRRSAQAFDGVTPLSREDFFSILDHCVPRPSLPPWGGRPAPTQVHLILFVHRVEGLSSGLYALPRDPAVAPRLRGAMRDNFLWEAVTDAPERLPLMCLLRADTRQLAARCACHQDIAADGVFCVAMLGDFEQGLAAGSRGYRRLMMEAGLIGQVFYLGAEACDRQGTGIGCFFDDALHELLGLHDRGFQVLYQFTVGKALVDTRIATEPPYPAFQQPTGA